MSFFKRIFGLTSDEDKAREKSASEARDSIKFALKHSSIRSLFALSDENNSPFFYSHLKHLYGKRWHERIVYDPEGWQQAELRTEQLSASCELLLSFINFPQKLPNESYPAVKVARDQFAHALLQYFFITPAGNLFDINITDYTPKGIEECKQREEILRSFNITLENDQVRHGLDQESLNGFVLDAIFYEVRADLDTTDYDPLTKEARLLEIDERYKDAFTRLNSLTSSF